MEYAFLGGPDSGATLRLDYRAFAYAGKFVVGAPGKAVLRTPDGSPAVPEWEPDEPLPPTVEASAFDDDVVAAVSFSPDRTDPDCCRLRYVTVHVARRGEGLGPRLIDRTVARLAADGYDRVKIAVNNPFAYAALHKCGFAYTGDRTGIAELELERPAAEPAAGAETGEEGEPVGDRYRAGLRAFRDGDRDLDPVEREFIAARLGDGEADGTGEE
ncbi:GNAT family N-acetyltransferase [Halorubrum salipaludis]|uniref:GNAT family N-acetyltransferase n=1 Tax=Halorubrum salipaludis TaxID=2032630 RepID=A0A2A2FAY1_9EURY|nr:GNAT family N-acetyltransferase [Halorubrum salipaludis]PAU82651.1 GNAT family N-acetyltransferase [Halorubrum salipaludis]